MAERSCRYQLFQGTPQACRSHEGLLTLKFDRVTQPFFFKSTEKIAIRDVAIS